jgi:hypothetical protein
LFQQERPTSPSLLGKWGLPGAPSDERSEERRVCWGKRHLPYRKTIFIKIF